LSNQLPHRIPGLSPLLYRAASDAGYTVAMLGKTHYVPQLTETDRIHVFWPYFCTDPVSAADRWRAPNRTNESTLEGLLVRAFEAFVGYARATRPAAPWFAHLSFVNPHPPNLCANLPARRAPLPLERVKAPRTALWFPTVKRNLDAWKQRWVGYRACYGATVEYVDDMVGAALRRVDPNTTLVLLTADHGDMLGDHGVGQKGVFFDAAWRVPLILAGPEVWPRPDGVERNLACGADVPMTLRRAMRARLTPGHAGVDLRFSWSQKQTSECRGYLGKAQMAIVNRDSKRVFFDRNSPHPSLYFDRRDGRDVWEEHNLAH
jgi:arylsulfatase A-like enzyme